ncbi:hypothetical protein ROZALSC1DRAFT_24173, partial [Rozella allomycis CSF55]
MLKARLYSFQAHPFIFRFGTIRPLNAYAISIDPSSRARNSVSAVQQGHLNRIINSSIKSANPVSTILPFIQTYIRQQELVCAEYLVEYMKNNHEALYEREVLSVQLCNAFVRQYMLRSVDVERSGYWVREMERYGVRPNGQTYLIFLRAELRNGGENVRRVLEEMRKVGVGLRAVLMVLDEDEGEALKEIVREGGKGIEEYWKELREIERKECSMENTTTSAASASTSASTSEPATSTNSTSLIN